MRAEIATAAVTGLHSVENGLPVQTDPNLPFDPPDDDAWARVAFQDGAQRFETIGGAAGNLERGPLLCFLDIFTPLGEGDGRATALAEGGKNGLRRLAVPGARFERFDGGPEGIVDGRWRKQIIAVFLRSQRV